MIRIGLLLGLPLALIGLLGLLAPDVSDHLSLLLTGLGLTGILLALSVSGITGPEEGGGEPSLLHEKKARKITE